MAGQTKAQKETMQRVMHEFKHGELESSTGRKVTNPKQAIAIGLHEAGAARDQDPQEKRQALKHTRRRERQGRTGDNAPRRHQAGEPTRDELYEQARKRDIPGRSRMNKGELRQALGRH